MKLNSSVWNDKDRRRTSDEIRKHGVAIEHTIIFAIDPDKNCEKNHVFQFS